MTENFALLGLLSVLAGLAGVVYRQWRRNATLKTQLEAAITDLQHLQQACSRLAPSGVLQHLIADGVRSGIDATAERPSCSPILSTIPR